MKGSPEHGAASRPLRLRYTLRRRLPGYLRAVTVQRVALCTVGLALTVCPPGWADRRRQVSEAGAVCLCLGGGCGRRSAAQLAWVRRRVGFATPMPPSMPTGTHSGPAGAATACRCGGNRPRARRTSRSTARCWLLDAAQSRSERRLTRCSLPVAVANAHLTLHAALLAATRYRNLARPADRVWPAAAAALRLPY